MARVLVPLAPGCEELEAVTIINLLRRADIEVISASLDSGPVKGAHNIILQADTTLDEALKSDYDMVVLPGGGPGSDRLDQDPRIEAVLQKMASAEKYTAAICAAPKVLGRIGLLTGKRATSYPGVVDKMALPEVTYLNEAVVQDGKVITSRGPGTAIDFALQLIEVLTNRARREQVEAGLVR
ncbi:MAG: DJ-1 family glyoxalase III [Thiohalomonadaceae bacterium]|jgi:4-methyl-5(b-hydroxyethyl)-thiazole monophosphate biosynthesis